MHAATMLDRMTAIVLCQHIDIVVLRFHVMLLNIVDRKMLVGK